MVYSGLKDKKIDKNDLFNQRTQFKLDTKNELEIELISNNIQVDNLSIDSKIYYLILNSQRFI